MPSDWLMKQTEQHMVCASYFLHVLNTALSACPMVCEYMCCLYVQYMGSSPVHIRRYPYVLVSPSYSTWLW